jgi:Na+/H+ antiporter NhaA
LVEEAGATGPVRSRTIAVLSWALGGGTSLLASGFAVYSLGDNEGSGPVTAAIAGGLLLLATYLVVSGIATLRERREERLRASTRTRLGAVAVAGLLVAAYVLFAAAPGDPAELDSWGALVAATVGLWLALTALARLGERLCWRAAGAISVALLLGSVAVAIWGGQ